MLDCIPTFTLGLVNGRINTRSATTTAGTSQLKAGTSGDEWSEAEAATAGEKLFAQRGWANFIAIGVEERLRRIS